MELALTLTFDDVSLVPCFSEVLPAEVTTQTELCAGVHLQVPILSAGMDTVTESAMARAIATAGGLGVIHKNMTAEEQAGEVRAVKEAPGGHSLRCAAALGVSSDTEHRARQLVEAGVDVFVVDAAHGHSKGVLETVSQLCAWFPRIPVIAGNVVSAAGALALVEAGTKVVKVGVGPGSICTTRVVAGVGVPQLSAIFEIASALKGSGVTLIADGGIKYSGDVVKALAAGAHAVMIGSLLAGCEESPGELILHQGQTFKGYRGMGSLGAMRDASGSRERYGQAAQRDVAKLVPEGVEGRVPYRGSAASVVAQLVGGLRSGMGYLGAKTLEDLRNNARFVRMTPAGFKESHVHDIAVTKEAPNYPVSVDAQ